MPEVTVVVPNWNRRDLIERLIDRFRSQTLPPKEILVVDNGSTDGSAQAAAAKGARVIALERNVGFTGAVNRAIPECRTEWIAIVNNDVEPAADWLEQMLKATVQPRVWFVTGKLVDAASPDSLDGTYDVVCRGACAWRAGHGRPDGPLWRTSRRIRIAPFTAALFRAELFQKVGLLDERFESYLEDVDFGLRCAAFGFCGVYTPDAVARHAGSSTLGVWHPDTVRRMARNQVLLVAKHYPLRYFFRYWWSIMVAQLLWGALAARQGRGFPFLRGKWEGLKLFRTVHREARSTRRKGLSKILNEGESEIFRIQRKTGFDLYWRLYFALTSLT